MDHVSGGGPASAEVGQDGTWAVDLTLASLRASAWRGTSLPKPFCAEVGRRMLLAELEFSEWVLRRVEKVRFQRDRSVSREIAIELTVRRDAPVFVDQDGQRCWLVPLSMMRRRTLVNLDLRDEDGASISMLGIRVAQMLDESILRTAAELAGHDPERVDERDEVETFIRGIVAGDVTQLRAEVDRMAVARRSPHTPLGRLLDDPAFSAVLARLRRNFTLYVALPVDLGRRRLLRMSFDEPTDWGYQLPSLTRLRDGGYRYRAGRPAAASGMPSRVATPAVARLPLRARLGILRRSIAAAIGWTPTRVRFQVPAAENTTSYHFEITAPHGVRIVRATLLAGRPNEPRRHVSWDDVVGHQPTVGLHAVEVPNGSLCRAQVDLRVPSRGWLSTMFLSCWVIVAVLASVVWYLFSQPDKWTNDRVTNVVLLLVTVAASAATLVAQRDAGGVAARLVAKLRAVGVVAIAIPGVGAAFLVYAGKTSAGTAEIAGSVRTALSLLLGLSVLTAALITVTWVRTLRDERQSIEQRSPWDMTADRSRKPPRNFRKAIRRFHFDSPAVGIQSAEGWHERYTWTDALQRRVVGELHRMPHTFATDPEPSQALGCRCGRVCRAADLRRALHDAVAGGTDGGTPSRQPGRTPH